MQIIIIIILIIINNKIMKFFKYKFNKNQHRKLKIIWKKNKKIKMKLID